MSPEGKGYQPTEEEIQNAEEHMSDTEKVMSEAREETTQHFKGLEKMRKDEEKKQDFWSNHFCGFQGGRGMHLGSLWAKEALEKVFERYFGKRWFSSKLCYVTIVEPGYVYPEGEYGRVFRDDPDSKREGKRYNERGCVLTVKGKSEKRGAESYPTFVDKFVSIEDEIQEVEKNLREKLQK